MSDTKYTKDNTKRGYNPLLPLWYSYIIVVWQRKTCITLLTLLNITTSFTINISQEKWKTHPTMSLKIPRC